MTDMQESDLHRMHPLVATASGRVACWAVQVEYWETLAEPWLKAKEPVPESVAQQLEHARRELEAECATLDVLQGKLDEQLAAERRAAAAMKFWSDLERGEPHPPAPRIETF
jgi:hypothetical protein